MSLAATLAHVDWQGRKINLIDTPGDAGFQADTIASLMVVEGALVVVSGVMGVEVNTGRVWGRAEELGLSRVVFVNMLDRERADFFRALGPLQEQLSARCVAVSLPIGAEHELTGIVDLLHKCAYMSPEGARDSKPVEIPAEMADRSREYREKLIDAVVETDEALMERYLETGEEPAADMANALKAAVTRDEIFPVACGVATKNLGTHALLDLLVEGVPSPARKEPVDRPARRRHGGLRLQDGRRPVRGAHQRLPRLSRARSRPTRTSSTRATTRRSASARCCSCRERITTKAERVGAGDIGAVAKLKDVQTGDVLARRRARRRAAADRASRSP